MYKDNQFTNLNKKDNIYNNSKPTHISMRGFAIMVNA